MYAHAGDLTTEDVENLLNSYKQLVLKYVSFCKGMGSTGTSFPVSTIQREKITESTAESRGSVQMVINNDKYEELTDDKSNEKSEGLTNNQSSEKYDGLISNQSSEFIFRFG